MARQSRRQQGEDNNNNNDNTRRDVNRAVARREASRLARPERRVVGRISHANRKKSAVTSTPSGYQAPQEEREQEDWCGPFSVARRVSIVSSCISGINGLTVRYR